MIVYQCDVCREQSLSSLGQRLVMEMPNGDHAQLDVCGHCRKKIDGIHAKHSNLAKIEIRDFIQLKQSINV
jgi:hypothetical protein